MKIFLLVSLTLTASAMADTALLTLKSKTEPNFVQGTPQVAITCEIFSTKLTVAREVQNVNIDTGAVSPGISSTEERPLQITGDLAKLIQSAKSGPFTNRNRGDDALPDYLTYTATGAAGNVILEQWDTRSVYRNVSKAGLRLKAFLDAHCKP